MPKVLICNFAALQLYRNLKFQLKAVSIKSSFWKKINSQITVTVENNLRLYTSETWQIYRDIAVCVPMTVTVTITISVTVTVSWPF